MRLLVLDHHKVFIAMLSEMIKILKHGSQLVEANSIQEATDLLDEDSFDLIFVNVDYLPFSCKTDAHIIGISSLDSIDIALKNGADLFLQLPVDSNNLQRILTCLTCTR